MLKNLVKKFTSHSLNDGEEEAAVPTGQHAAETMAGTIAKPRLQAGGGQQPPLRRQPLPPPTPRHPGYGCSKYPKRTSVGRRSQATLGTASSVSSGRSRGSEPSDPGQGDELKDSGTESDEELAMIETNSIKSVPVSLTSDYYTSQQSLSASCRSSHCGSPSIDQDCTSWDGFGYESGLWTTRNSEQSTAELEVELPHHHYHTRQQFKRFVKFQQQKQQGSSCPSVPLAFEARKPVPLHQETIREVPTGADDDSDDSAPHLASPTVSCGSSVDELESINGSVSVSEPTDATAVASALKEKDSDVEFLAPQTTSNGSRGRSSFVACKGAGGDLKLRSGSLSGARAASGCTSGAAEKRKWSQVSSSDSISAFHSGDARDCGGQFADARTTTATGGASFARRTPVRLLIPLDPGGVGDSGVTVDARLHGGRICSTGTATADVKNPSPRKKCRSAVSLPEADAASDAGSERQRPSLNFEKMREKLKKKHHKNQGRSGTNAMKSKLRGWNIGYQLRSSHSECLFQPLKYPPSPPTTSSQAGCGD